MPELPPANGRAAADGDGLGDLAEHGRFVRNLAWRLLHDEDAAEEVVQETMLAAVKARPDRSRSLRPWLATVARNVIRKRFRGDGRRRRREEVAAKPEALPGTADMLARAEMLKEVVDAVLALDEPNRSTVLLRYYEDLPPREIAKRQGVGVETVRGRLKRAVVQLRRRLDRRHPDGRAGWVPVLAGLCGMEVPAQILGASSGATAGGEGVAAGEAAAVEAPAALAGGLQGMAAAFLVGAAVSAGLTWWGTADDGTSAVRRDAMRAAATAPADLPSAVVDAAAPTLAPGRDAARRLAAARERNAQLKEQVRQLTARVAAFEPPPPDPRAFHFALPERTPAFDAANWDALARAVLELSKVLDTIRVEVVSSREPQPKTQAKAIELNAPLGQFAVSILDELGVGTPGEAFTHPSVLANLIRAALDVLGEPLSREQTLAIHTMGAAWETEAVRLEQETAPGAPLLARRAAAVDARLRFLRAVKDVLHDRQRAALFRVETEGRLQLDLLCAAWMYNGTRVPVDAGDREGLERALVETLLTLAGIEDEDAATYAWIGERWLDELPYCAEPHYPWELDVVFTTVDALQAQARAQIRAIEGIVGSRRLTEAEAGRLLRVTSLLRPRIRRVLSPEPAPGDD